MNCPTCGESSQVLKLEEFWRSLSQDAELKRDLAQPPSYAAQWLVPLGLIVLGFIVLTSGGVGAGLLLLLAGLGTGAWMWRASAAAEEARERWRRLLYCRRCPAQFEP
ncbi:hypothetical protein [Streptomyces lunaelactis]|uniref:hypothetical protein n=1 Tax=Streptomyces lunaelactis TaxID=1535768 RepID=UPI001585AEDE|nr:hypothetical protein [Streptomyces lunaelactis]NUL14489.1 hypothetical protein [Streptomyces lunaelactis]